MPPKKIESVPVSTLSDLPPSYLLEKSQWSDFKKAITTCGLIWNLPDWMSTIVYQGIDYVEMKKKEPSLDDIFPSPTMTVGENEVKVGETSSKLLKLFGLPKTFGTKYSTIKFCNLSKLEFELDSKLPARQKLWSWIFYSSRLL
jgi:hypothetical protein